MMIHASNRLRSVVFQCTRNQTRSFFYWLTIIFNRVDEERIKKLGPDLACAEWLLRNGAFVRWKGFSEKLTDYNSLPSAGNKYYIEAVDADNAGISHIGFPYFEGCKHIKEIKLKNCRYINNDAIPLLSVLQDSLINLELVNCKSITDEGLHNIKLLKNLEMLQIQGLPYLKDKDLIRKEIIQALPKCKIDIL
ncbi:ATP synthase subunit s, mitochondrial [Hylaeus anthracinus]|uniref:ATP synthase subunit s, mitochondrial n=1 Tax=Hylaeus volcanicus TaxID=313075 RepID=UPI0023B8392A|nr:ATP synthase subunit s, mitochondrial [Hylaeus volcanicus]XP_054015267.1 ATP synthase subunit s, mitochondrial [Hylaeus anthracinus]